MGQSKLLASAGALIYYCRELRGAQILRLAAAVVDPSSNSAGGPFWSALRRLNLWLRPPVALSVVLLFVGNLAAQGPVYRERWGYLHLENRRGELLRELQAVEPARGDAVADLLLAADDGVPFGPVGKALARLRGTTADEAFVLRMAISAFVLPEVADPDGQNEGCRSTSISMFLPFSLPLPGVLAFDLDVIDRTGATVWSTRIERDTGLSELRMGQTSAKVPSAELADGAYEVRVRTLIDGKAPSATDPVLVWTMHVLRGYQARSEAALARVREVAATLPELQSALLNGLASQVARAYMGEAFAVASNAVVELQLLERALQNVAEDKPVLAGLTGDVLTHLPGEAAGLPCALRLPGPTTPRPLVVFAAGAPCYDQSPRRPTAPQTREPAWSAHELASFGAGRDWNVAFIDSPGGGRNYAGDLRRGLAALRELLATGDQPVVLVCDREAAVVVSYHIDSLREHLAGIVLVGAGLQGSTLDSLGSLPLRFGPVRGLPSREAIRRSIDYVEQQRSKGLWHGDVEALPTEAPVWLFALPRFAAGIERFVAEVVAR